MTALEVLHEARQRGLRLHARDDGTLAVFPARNCPPEFATCLRQHKGELLVLLRLSADQLPWVHVARQVMSGEFDDADRSTIESLWIGLRSLAHPLAAQALARLRRAPGCPAHLKE
jgi:hypothetical protein